jgi:hypothetical protein
MRRTLAFLIACCIAVALARGQENVVEKFTGADPQTTTPAFTVKDNWELRWDAQPAYMSISVVAPDGSVVAGASALQAGSLFLAKGGTYQLKVHRDAGKSPAWTITVVDSVAPETPPAAGPAPPFTANYVPPPAEAAATTVAASPPASTNAAPASAMPFEVQPPADEHAAPTGSLTEAQAHAVVVIKGDAAEGTGFLVHGPDGPAVITNLHVLAANPNVKILTTTGEVVTTTGLKGASDRDLALISIKDNHYSYLDLDTDIAGTVQNGDEVITPGNSEGGEVVLDTHGTVLGVGPERIEISNPIYHGNSGGPVVHLKSGRVIAVVTQALKVRPQDDLDRASFANKNSAIIATMRYFGLRVDTVPKWEAYDWPQFLDETTFISNFHDLSRCLDSLMNGAAYERAHLATGDEYGPPNSQYYQKNPKIVAAHDNFHRLSTDADQSQKLDASREMVMDLDGIAATDMDAIKRPGNFYSFDEIRVQQEIKYREALQKEIDSAGDRISDMGH